MGEHEASGPLWAGRLEGGLHPDVLALSQSLDIDCRLLPYDVAASKAHARMLGRQGIIPADDAAAIVQALDAVTIDDGATDEDVHSLIERQLVAQLGDVGRRVHAGRSRNDQVATAFRLWCRAHAFALIQATADLQTVLVSRAQTDGSAVLPAFTHLQRAQPVPLAHHLAAHVWSLQRDIGRFQAAQDAADVSPLGAGALAGSSLPLDPVGVAADLGMASSFTNSLDAVSDRDFAVDLLYACTLCLVHWSSMMPQKKNPDVAELARGRAGTAIGRLTGLLATLKGLPLTYNRDLQEDKQGVFEQVDATLGVLRLLSLAYEGLTFEVETMRAAAADGTTVATDVAEGLVRGGMPFRDAHTEVANRIAAGERFDSPTPEEAIAARKGPGMPGVVSEQLVALAGLIAATRALTAPSL